MVEQITVCKSLKDSKHPWGCKGFDVGLELEAACRVTPLDHGKPGEFKINANENYALAA